MPFSHLQCLVKWLWAVDWKSAIELLVHVKDIDLQGRLPTGCPATRPSVTPAAKGRLRRSNYSSTRAVNLQLYECSESNKGVKDTVGQILQEKQESSIKRRSHPPCGGTPQDLISENGREWQDANMIFPESRSLASNCWDCERTQFEGQWRKWRYLF